MENTFLGTMFRKTQTLVNLKPCQENEAP